MAETVFTSQTPAVTNGDDNVYYTLVTRIQISADGYVTGIRYYMPDGTPTSITAALFARGTDAAGAASGTATGVLGLPFVVSSSTLLGTASFSSTTPGWQTAAFSSPIRILSGADLYAAVYTDTYVYTGSFFSSSGVTSGVLTAPQDDSVTPARNGRFYVGGAGPTYPNNGGGTCYFVDVAFASDVSGTGTPTTSPGTAAGTGAVGTGGNTGTGTPTTGPGTAAGTGTLSTSGTGTPTTGPGATAGSGSIGTTGAGTATGGPGTAAGTGAISTSGTGTSSTGPGTVAGTGSVGSSGTGTLTTGPGVAAGAGNTFSGAVGSASTGPGTAAGTGSLSTSGAGVPTTGPGAASGTGSVGVSGTGTTGTGPGTASGAGTTGLSGVGTAGTGPGATAGSGSVGTTGAGAAVTQAGTVAGVASTGAAHWYGTGVLASAPGTAAGTGTVERWPGVGPPLTVPDLRRAMIEFLRGHPYADPQLTIAGAVADDLPTVLLPYAAVFAPPSGPHPVWCAIAAQTLNIQVWAETEAAAWTSCEMVRAMTHDAPGRVIDEVAVLSCVDVTGVGIVPDPGYPSFYRAVCTVDVTGRWAI